MTPDSNTHPHDDLAVYALDALDPDERVAIDAHLTDCPACRAELDRHLDTLAQLTTSEAPPGHVWDRIAGQLSVADAPSARVVPLRSRTPWLTAVAAAVVVVVGVAVWAVSSREGTQDVGERAAAAADDPSSTVVRLASGAGEPQARVVVAADGAGYVLFDDLPTLPAGRSYQLWKLNDPEMPISLGVLGDGSGDAQAVAVPDDATSFAISDEPDGGVPSPTGPIVATGIVA